MNTLSLCNAVSDFIEQNAGYELVLVYSKLHDGILLLWVSSSMIHFPLHIVTLPELYDVLFMKGTLYSYFIQDSIYFILILSLILSFCS